MRRNRKIAAVIVGVCIVAIPVFVAAIVNVGNFHENSLNNEAADSNKEISASDGGEDKSQIDQSEEKDSGVGSEEQKSIKSSERVQENPSDNEKVGDNKTDFDNGLEEAGTPMTEPEVSEESKWSGYY